ncbi:TPA: hypothetical protein DCW54_00315 [Candidatus Dependentiae bacterium]|nr:hypothetical protein [Candidatus Dependentiae bacterium]
MNAVTIGSAVCDVTLSGTALQSHAYLSHHAGSKVPIEEVIMRAGGGAINSALIMHKLGIQTYPVCCFGTDPFSNTIQTTLTQNNIYVDYVKISDKSKTALSFLLPHESNQTTILTYKGAGTTLDYQWAETITNRSWDIVYIAPISGPLNQHLVALVNKIRHHNPDCIVAHNPNPHQLTTTMAEQKKLLPLLNLYILNYQEAEIAWHQEHSTPFNLDQYLKEISTLAPKCIIVVTQGARGLEWRQDTSRAHIDAQPINQLHSVGAGDSCGATIAAALAHKHNTKDSIELGMRIAEKVLSHTSIEAVIDLENLEQREPYK